MDCLVSKNSKKCNHKINQPLADKPNSYDCINALSSWKTADKKKDQWPTYRLTELITDKPYFLFTHIVIRLYSTVP